MASLSPATPLPSGPQQSPLLPAEDLTSRTAEKATDIKMIPILESSQRALPQHYRYYCPTGTTLMGYGLAPLKKNTINPKPGGFALLQSFWQTDKYTTRICQLQ